MTKPTAPLRPQSAEQWLARQGLADLSLYWPTNKPLPQVDYASGEARPTLIELLEAYARAAAPQTTRENRQTFPDAFMVEAALDKYLPSGYAIGDEATAVLAVKLAKAEQDLFKLRKSPQPERIEICEVCGKNIGPICMRIVWWDEKVKQHQRHAIDCLAKPENMLAGLGESPAAAPQHETLPVDQLEAVLYVVEELSPSCQVWTPVQFGSFVGEQETEALALLEQFVATYPMRQFRVARYLRDDQ